MTASIATISSGERSRHRPTVSSGPRPSCLSRWARRFAARSTWAYVSSVAPAARAIASGVRSAVASNSSCTDVTPGRVRAGTSARLRDSVVPASRSAETGDAPCATICSSRSRNCRPSCPARASSKRSERTSMCASRPPSAGMACRVMSNWVASSPAGNGSSPRSPSTASSRPAPKSTEVTSSAIALCGRSKTTAVLMAAEVLPWARSSSTSRLTGKCWWPSDCRSCCPVLRISSVTLVWAPGSARTGMVLAK